MTPEPDARLLPDSIAHPLLARAPEWATPFIQLAQITQTLFQKAQLDIIESISHFFAIARNERHCRAFIEQGDGCTDLRRHHRQFLGNHLNDLHLGSFVGRDRR